MNLSGDFTTSSTVDALCALEGQTGRLATVPMLSEVTSGPDRSIDALFSPATPFGRAPMAVRIVPLETSTDGARLRVHGRHGPHAVDVQLALTFVPDSAGTKVSWQAEVDVLGPAASVAQRVACDLARRAIGEVLSSAADCAAR